MNDLVLFGVVAIAVLTFASVERQGEIERSLRKTEATLERIEMDLRSISNLAEEWERRAQTQRLGLQ